MEEYLQHDNFQILEFSVYKTVPWLFIKSTNFIPFRPWAYFDDNLPVSICCKMGICCPVTWAEAPEQTASVIRIHTTKHKWMSGEGEVLPLSQSHSACPSEQAGESRAMWELFHILHLLIQLTSPHFSFKHLSCASHLWSSRWFFKKKGRKKCHTLQEENGIQKSCGQANLWIQYVGNNTIFIISVLFVEDHVIMRKNITTFYPTEM